MARQEFGKLESALEYAIKRIKVEYGSVSKFADVFNEKVNYVSTRGTALSKESVSAMLSKPKNGKKPTVNYKFLYALFSGLWGVKLEKVKTVKYVVYEQAA